MDSIDIFNKAAALAEFELSAYEPSQICASDKPEIVFSGKSNVGKSSMINRLIVRKRLARVSSAPGKTASVNFYNCGAFRLVDLPGYGYAKVSKQEQKHWSELVEGYLGGERNISLVVQLVDARHAPSVGDRQMIDYLSKRRLPFVVVLTKTDKLKSTELAKRRLEVPQELGLSDAEIIFTSAETSLGFEELKKLILESIQSDLPSTF
jgi:GTP-binding protein